MSARLVDGRSSFHLACQMGLEDVVRAMLERNAENKQRVVAEAKALSTEAKEPEGEATDQGADLVCRTKFHPAVVSRLIWSCRCGSHRTTTGLSMTE